LPGKKKTDSPLKNLKEGDKIMKRKTILVILCLTLMFSIVGTMALPVLAKTDYSDGASSLIVNKLNADGSIDWSYEYNGENEDSYEADGNTYYFYEYPDLEDLADYYYYSTIDAMPAAVGTKAWGVTIADLISNANENKPSGEDDITWSSGQKFVLYPTDGYGYPYQGNNFYTYDFVQGQSRYYYTNLVEKYTAYRSSGDPADLTGWDANPEAVEPVLCLSSYQARYATDAILDADPEMDSKESFRFCMGLTPTEASNGIAGTYSSTNKFCRWVYRIDFGPVNTPVLTPDTTSNLVNTAIDITFTDNSAWRSAITGITVDSVTVNPAHYTVSAGDIAFDNTVFTTRGAYTVAVSATGYPVDCVTQNIYALSPTLTADSTNNTTGVSIDITFTDDAAWRGDIIGITVDGLEVDPAHYTISAGNISFDSTVFTSTGNHAVVVSASYYTDATVAQAIQ
jgi:hypothetical protein